MSEYQYYEFQALDRRLTAAEMAKLRAASTRAKITPTSFVNDYEYGDFKGDEDAWMDQYFDAFLYFANWGTRVLKLRLPSRLLDGKTADLYCLTDSVSAREHKGNTILTFTSNDSSRRKNRGWRSTSNASSASRTLCPHHLHREPSASCCAPRRKPPTNTAAQRQREPQPKGSDASTRRQWHARSTSRRSRAESPPCGPRSKA